MSKKDLTWKKILEESSIKNSFNRWLSDEESIPFFEIPNSIFKEMKVSPGKTILHYQLSELPQPLVERNLEIFRHGLGTCVLTNTGSNRRWFSVFQDLPDCEKINYTPSHPLSDDSLFFRSEILNEDNFLYIAQRIGVLEDFVKRKHSDIKIRH